MSPDTSQLVPPHGGCFELLKEEAAARSRASELPCCSSGTG